MLSTRTCGVFMTFSGDVLTAWTRSDHELPYPIMAHSAPFVSSLHVKPAQIAVANGRGACRTRAMPHGRDWVIRWRSGSQACGIGHPWRFADAPNPCTL